MSNYFKCDSCGREINGCSIVNGMSFCEKCYQETFGKDNQQNEIQQLKQQLDESFTEEDVEGLIKDREKTIKFLQEQLAEKQNTINEINNEFVQAIHDWKTLYAEKDKEKTQLAIQELEKVKYYICDCTYIKEPDYTNVRCKIDQQIKELKGE